MHVAAQVVAIHLVMQPLDLGDFRVGDVFAGQPAGEASSPPITRTVREFALAELAHAGAAIRQQFDQSFGRQHLQGFAQRRARNAEHLAKLAFGNARAVREGCLRRYSRAAASRISPCRDGSSAGGRRRSRRRGDRTLVSGISGFHVQHNSRRCGASIAIMNTKIRVDITKMNSI